MVKGLTVDWGKCYRTVTFDCEARTVSCWNKSAAVGLASGEIIILNVVTGGFVAVLSGHSEKVYSITFSSDGALLVSGSGDKTVKLWDVQTGGIIKIFPGHMAAVRSVSISVESTTIASGSADNTICLWDIQTGVCQCIIEQNGEVDHVSFSPIKPYNLLSISLSDCKLREWDINGDQIGETFDSWCAVLSLDGTKFALNHHNLITVRNSENKAIIAEFQVTRQIRICNFSPDGKYIAETTQDLGDNINVWDITSLSPQTIETFKGNNSCICGLAFSSPSSLISISLDGSVKFWQILSSSVEKTETDISLASHLLDKYGPIILQEKDGIIITSDHNGVVDVWDISTGVCKETFQTPAKLSPMDCRLVGGKLIAVWHTQNLDDDNDDDDDYAHYVHVWDSEKKEDTVIDHIYVSHFDPPRISEDGSRVFYFLDDGVKVYSIQTGEVLGEVLLGKEESPSLHTIDGYQVWISSELGLQGWDFSTPGLSPVQLSNVSPSKLHPCGAVLWDTQLHRVQDVATGKIVFQLTRRFGEPVEVEWNKQYLVACFRPIDVLILDFGYLFCK